MRILLLSCLLAGAVGCSAGGVSSDVGPDSDWRLDTDRQEPGDADATDGDGEEAGDLTLDLGEHGPSGAGFEPYTDGAGEFELVRGFQGGFHLEPVLYLVGVEQSEFTAEIDYEIRRRSDGDLLNRETTFEIGPRQWSDHEEGYLHFSNPVIFTAGQPDAVIGTPVELVVTLDVQGGGSVHVSHVGTVVDEQSR
jgi:hypothetical protein